MTSEAIRRKRPSTTAMTAKVTAIAVAAAVALTGGLAIQMAAGHDPALPAGTKNQASTQSNTSSSSANTSSGSADSSSTFAPAQQQPAQVTTQTS